MASTPAPWIVITNDPHEAGRVFVETSDACVVAVIGNGALFKDRFDNARLIAAAPELLEACLLLMKQYDASGDFTMGGELTNEPFLLARAAIEKAFPSRG